MKMLTCLVLVAGMSTGAGPLFAHHGRGATFDMTKQVTLKGTVSEVSWRNPHVVIYLDVKDPAGNVVNWAFENSSVATLARQGYSRNTMKVGEEITAIVNPAAQGAPRGIIVKVILADGRQVMSRETGANPVD